MTARLTLRVTLTESAVYELRDRKGLLVGTLSVDLDRADGIPIDGPMRKMLVDAVQREKGGIRAPRIRDVQTKAGQRLFAAGLVTETGRLTTAGCLQGRVRP